MPINAVRSAIFGDAIRQMSIVDTKNILDGGEKEDQDKSGGAHD